ncbi:MAG: DUF5343 domain-containing protein [Fimbriimonadaceae bacterium]|nr:DUF5343 domain-containing protein [Fimbriimonadaceae bacterium]
MSLPTNYMAGGTGNVSKILAKIVEGAPPAKFTQAHLKGIGFKASGDRAILPVLKAIGFLTSEGAPTQRYHDYRDKSKSKQVLGAALREAYASLFQINENLSESDRTAIEGKFTSEGGLDESKSKLAAATFLAFWKLADHSAKAGTIPTEQEDVEELAIGEKGTPGGRKFSTGLHYNIEIHLPATKDIEVFNAIFRALRENLLEE